MKKVLSIIITLIIGALTVFAQTSTGRLTGTVSSADGVLPNAKIVVKDNKTGKELNVTSQEDGSFLFPQLEFGTYTVTVSVTGFKTFVASEVKIDVGRDYSLNPVLEVGNVQETVNVVAGEDVVTATSAQVSNTVSPQQIMSLPLLSRNPLSLTTQQAGTQSNAYQETMINGMRTSFTNITRDGINIQDNFIRQNATDFAPGNPSVDDTAEFTITTTNQEADQGYGGAQIRLVTPRGTQDFHGALYVYNRNSGFAANDFFNNRSTNPDISRKPAFRNRFQYGGKVGGPFPVFNFGEDEPAFFKNKGFFFFSYEKIKDPISGLQTRTILTPAARTGGFSYQRTDGLTTAINSNGVTCPAGSTTCTVTNILALANSLGFANTPTTINPVIQSRILSNLPAQGNFTGVGDQVVTTGFQFNRKADTGRDTYSTRIDLDINDRNTINGVYSWTRDITLRNSLDPSGFTEVPRGDLNATSETFALAYRGIFTPTFVNEVRGGVFYNNVAFGAFENPSLLLALPLISNPENNTGNQGRVVKTYNLQDNVDWVLGNHSLRFGGQLQWFKPTSRDTFGILPTLSIGTSTVTPFFTCPTLANCNFPGGISTSQLGTANALLGLLGGYVTQEAQTFNLVSPQDGFVSGAANIAPYEYTNHSLYIADRWQTFKNLTLTLGLRYELYGALRQTNDKALEVVITDPNNPVASLLNPNATADVIGGNSGSQSAFYKTDYNNFAPQVGFAYSPKVEGRIGKLLLGETFVIRGGYSHIYGVDQLVTSVLQAPGNISGLASRNAFGLTPGGSAQLNLRLGDALPPIITPTLTPAPPYSFIRNSTPGIVNATQGATFFTTDPKLQTPMYQQYSLGIQREFGGNMALEIRYVGTRSNNLVRAYNVNQIDVVNNGFLADFNRAASNLRTTGTAFCNPATVAGCQALTIFRSSAAPTANTVGGATAGAGRLLVGTGGLSLANFNAGLGAGTPPDLAVLFYQQGFNNHPTLTNPTAVPFINILPNPAAGLVALLTNDATSNYNSLQAEVRRRFSQGLYFQANYTFSKNLVNAIGGDQFYFEPYLDNNNKSLDNQRSDGDQTHVFNFNGVYQLPFGRGKTFLNYGGIGDKVFGGWEISGLMTWSTGSPISIVDPRGTYNTTGRSGRQTAQSNLTADQIRGLTGIFERNGNIYFIDPSIINTDGRAATAYSLTNQTTFAGQVFFVNQPGQTGNLGRTLINGPRYLNVNAALLKNVRFTESMRVQLRAEAFNLLNNVNFFNNTQNASILSTTFGQITSAGGARIIQFGARFEF